MLLADLLTSVQPLRVEGELRRPIEHVRDDSRRVGRGDLFVALRGARFDARTLTAGLQVAAVLGEPPFDVAPGVTKVEVHDAPLALALVAAAAEGHPSRGLEVVGVTGTNGKTTTTWMIERLLGEAGLSCGVVGTTGARLGPWAAPLANTTPTALELQHLLRGMKDRGARAVAMEVSSIGLDQRRVDGTRFSVAVFTNLSQDHLDYHGTMAAYLQAKARLFDELLASDGTAVLFAGDPAHHALHPRGRRVWTTSVVDGTGTPPGPGPRGVGAQGARVPSDLEATILERTPRGTRLEVRSPQGLATAWLPLLGDHNVENALGALGAGLALGADLKRALRGLEALTRVPGRLDAIHASAGFTVVVDYAHTPDALQRVLVGLRRVTAGRLMVVFGCGGDRDRAKRPIMGRIAAEGADRVVLTSDNPRSEDPERILDEIEAGLRAATPRPGALPFVREADRRAAIAWALDQARQGDVVLLAGKGHEATQTLADRVVPFDDRAVALDLLGAAA